MHAAGALFGGDDLEDVLEGQRLEVQAGGDVVVGGDGLRVAVDHHGLVAGLAQRHGGVDAGVVELDALADAVGAGAEDQDGRLGVQRNLVLLVVGRVVVRGVGGELGGAGVHGLVDRADAQGLADTADHGLGVVRQGADLLVGEAVALGALEHLHGQGTGLADLAGDLVEQLELVQEPGIDLGGLVELFDGGAAEHGALDLVQALRGGALGLLDELRDFPFRDGAEVQLRALLLQGAQRLLQRFGEVAAHGHGLAHGLHGGGQGVVGGRELLEREARNLDHHVVQGGFEGRRGLLRDVVRDLVQGVAEGELGGDLGDGEPGGLGRQGRGAGHARVHLDDHHAAGVRLDGELDVAAAGVDAHFADDGDGDVAQPLVFAVGEGQRRRHGDGVAGVDAYGIEVLDGADNNDVVVLVPHHLELVFLPAEDALFEQHLAGGAVLQALAHDAAEVVLVVRQAGTQAAHGEGRADHHRVAQVFGCLEGLVHGVDDVAAGGFGAAAFHHALELFAVLAELDGRDVRADELHVVLLQHTVLVQRDGGVQCGLAAQGGQDGVRAFLGDDLLHHLGGDGLDVGGVGELGVRHDGGRVGVHQDDAEALLLEDTQCLGAGVVEFGGLADDDRAGTDDQDALKVSSLGHYFLSSVLESVVFFAPSAADLVSAIRSMKRSNR